LKERKVTLDTGMTTFWQAFDQFCEKAGLVEATAQDLNQGGPGFPGGGVVPPGKALPPIQIQPAPAPPQKLPLKGAGAGQFNAQVAVAVQAAQAAPAQPAQAVQPLPAIKRRPFQPFVPMQYGQLLLKDGKPKKVPTCYSGAVRVRVMDDAQQMFGQ